MALTYLVVIETGANNLSAYVPDIPGCVTTGQTIPETLTNMQEALQGHLEGMLEDGEPIPSPTTQRVELEQGDSLHHIAINITAQVTP